MPGNRRGLKSPVAFLQGPVEGTPRVSLGAGDVSGAAAGSSWRWRFLLVRDIGVSCSFFPPAVQKNGCKSGKSFRA